jgi:hypothetical protein
MRSSLTHIFAYLAIATPMFAACTAKQNVVGDDASSDAGNGRGNGTPAGSLPEDAGALDASHQNLPTDAGPFNDDAAPPTHDDGGPMSCGSSITFDLAIDSTNPVCSAGLGSGWLGSFGCGNWLAVSPADAVSSPLSLDGECTPSCVAFPPSAANSQSYTWNGTYYPVTNTSQGPVCGAPTCAPAGTYVATFCVADGTLPDASMNFCMAPDEAPPTCKQVTFTWPPASANASVQATLMPTLDGG